MELDGEKRRELREALLSAFPSLGTVELMVHDCLDIRLANVVPTSGPLVDVIFRLVEYVEAQGLLERLAERARGVNPGNPKLKAFTARWIIAGGKAGLLGDAGPKQTPSAPKASRGPLELLYEAALAMGLDAPEVRAILLRSLPEAVATNLPTTSRPGDQLYSDMVELGRLGTMKAPPLAEWLRTALVIRGFHPQAEVLREALAREDPRESDPGPDASR